MPFFLSKISYKQSLSEVASPAFDLKIYFDFILIFVIEAPLYERI